MTHHVAARMAVCLVPGWWQMRFAMAVAVLAVFTVPAAQAQLSISASGTPVVNLPLTLPPGIAGLVPSLALVYDGRAVNGPVGQGWSLQGTSAITRCNGIAAIDGVPRSVANVPDDKLCFDSQRLLQTDASGNITAFPQIGDSLGPDAGIREYRTETDSFARIRAYGSAGGVPANGPAYFKVWTKSGQIIEYGNAQNATANATVTPIGKTVVATWLVSRISDLRGNYVDFQYEQRDVPWGSLVGGAAVPGRELTLQEIRYTGTPARVPSNKVTFVYDERPATAPAGRAHDRSEVYAVGSKNVSIKRLAKIQTFINVPAAAVKVKTFKLTYSQGPASNRSRLDQVAECAGPAEQPCLPATRFEYAAGPTQAYQPNTAFRGSALAGLVLHSTPPPDSYMGGAPTIKYGVIPADFDGDGKTDVLRWSENPAENQLHLSNGDGSFRQASTFNITDQTFYRHDGCYSSRVADFDGNGLPDILRYRNTRGSYPGQGPSHLCPAGATEIYFSNGDGSFTRKTVTGVTVENGRSILTHGDPPPGEPQGDKIGWSPGSTYYLLDINGDGRLDVVTAYLPPQGNVDPPEPSNPCKTTCTRVFLGDGQGNFSEIATNVANKTLYSPPEGEYTLGQPSHLSDVDGDGLTDIIGAGAFGQEMTNDRARVWHNRGDGNFDEVDVGRTPGQYFPLDFNADGRMDAIVPYSVVANALYLADGTGSMRGVAHNFTSALMERTNDLKKYLANIVVADFDLDGRHDVLRWNEDPSKNTLFLSNGDGTFRESTSFNLKTAEHALQNSTGTNGFVLGDFTGRGQSEILRMAATPGTSGAQSNQLYLQGTALPPEHLVAVVSAQGLRTDLTWVPLGNPASGSLGPRYSADRNDAANSAAYPMFDTLAVGHVVVTTTADSGVAGQRITTEYSYRGQKASHDGRGGLGMREVRHQQTGADGSSLLTTVTQSLQKHPYVGAVAQTETWLGALNQTSPTVLSRSRQIHCDKTAAAGAEATASASTPCPTTAKIQRPYVYKSLSEGKDLAGIALPTVTTTTSVNDSGDPVQVVSSTVGSVGAGNTGVSQTITRTTTHQYQANQTAGEQWILGRVQQTTVQSSVPNSLANLGSSTGTAANAAATAGNGPLQAGTLSSLGFGNVVVGLSSTLNATLTSNGLAALSLTAPGASSVSGTDFSFVSSTCGATLAVGSSCSVSVRFSPSSAVARSGTLALSTGAGTLTANLGGSGIGGSSTAVLTSSTALAFGAVTVGTASPSQAWTFRNDGNGLLSLALGALNAPFSLVGNTCTNVLPGSTCALSVQMATTTAGTYSQGGIALTGAGQGNRSDLSLGGSVIAPTTLSTSPAPLAFGTVNKDTVKSLTLTVSNTGATAALGLGYAFANPPGAVVQGSYAFAPGVSGWGTCPAAGGSLAAGASCTLIVKYSSSCTGGSNNGNFSISGTNFPTRVTPVTATTRATGTC